VDDLDGIAGYIARDSPNYAAAFVIEMRDAARSLALKLPPFFGQVVKPRLWENGKSKNREGQMAQKRKTHSEEFKARVAMEAIKGVRTLQ
jgi:hypothetical protein